MESLQDHVVREPPTERLLPIVVGAHLEAEVHDRPVAESLRAMILRELGPDGRLEPIVLTDLWYLNQAPLRCRPTITIGRPEINSATAYLANQIPTALLVESAYRIQIDPEGIDPYACVWGTGPETTACAVRCFCDRYLAGYLADIAHLAG